MSQKHTDSLFLHFLEMLAVNYPGKRGGVDLSAENINDLVLLLSFTEGEEKMSELKAELAEIVQKKDLLKFKTKEIKEQKQLELIAEVVLKKK